MADNNPHQSDVNLRMAQRMLGIGVWTMDLASGTLSWSDNLYAMYGTTPKTFGHRYEDYVALVHPEDRMAMQANFEAFAENPEDHFEFEHRVVSREGEVIHVRGLAELVATSTGQVLTGVVQDISEQVATEQRLKQNASLLQLAGRAAQLGGWRVDLSPLSFHWTDQTAAIHEVGDDRPTSIDEAIAFYAPEYRDTIRSAFADCAGDGTPFDHVLQIVSARGRRIWVRVVGQPERNPDGSITAVQGAIQDIGELIETRQRSQELTRRLVSTLETMGDAFLALDDNWRVTFINRKGEELLACSRGDLLGKVVWEAFPEAGGSVFQTHYEHAKRTGKVVRFTEYFEPLEKWFEINVHPSSKALAIYFRDVTERKCAEEQLRQSNERFELVTRATNDVIWDLDVVSGQIWWNDNFMTLLGHDPVAKGSDLSAWAELVHAEDRARVAASLDAAIDGADPRWSEEYRIVHRDGHALTVSDRGFIIRDQAGKALRMIGSMVDISDRRALDERLHQSQKLEAIGQLTGGVAHDFNNLLTVILGNAEMLVEQLTDQQQLRLMAEMTATAAERGSELTNRLLAFARRQPLDPKAIDVNRQVRGMDGLLRRTLNEDIDIEFVQSGGLWQAEVDPGQLEVALLNLAINARDAMSHGGCLTLETANVRLDEEYAEAHQEVEAGQYVMVSVSDTGSGMTPEVIKRAFEPFYTTKDIGKGSGLGLSMVYGFVKQSRGHIKIYSELGEGTTIKLYFPRAYGAVEPDQPSSQVMSSPGGSEHILVVEDDALVRDYLVAQLHKLGYRVSAAANGRQALDKLEQGDHFDLLFTDIVMPGGINGRQLADLAWQQRPDLKVLFTSGYTENAIVHHGRLDQGVQLLSKPYRLQEMSAKVRKVLDNS